MQIQNTLSHVNSFFDLLPIVKEAKAELSFFGAQYVSVTGYEGTLEIDALAAKVIDLVKKILNLAKKTALLAKRSLHSSTEMFIS